MEERCIVCGEAVPEGQKVCEACSEKTVNYVRILSDMAVELDKKETPKPVNNKKPVADVFFGDCPACGETELDSEMRYCHQCGQRLDWGRGRMIEEKYVSVYDLERAISKELFMTDNVKTAFMKIVNGVPAADVEPVRRGNGRGGGGR